MVLVGWFLFGGGIGYLIERWRLGLVLGVVIVGLSMIVGDSPPQLTDVTWQTVLANFAGIWLGMYLGKRDTHP